MDKSEVLKALNSMAPAKQLTLSEVAEVMGAKAELLTSEHIEAMKVMNSLKEKGITDPVATIAKYEERQRADALVVRNARLDAEFGPEGADKKNLLRIYAGEKVGEASGEDLEKRINAVKDDPIAKRLSAEKMDVHSAQNHLGKVDQKSDEPPASSARVDEV